MLLVPKILLVTILLITTFIFFDLVSFILSKTSGAVDNFVYDAERPVSQTTLAALEI